MAAASRGLGPLLTNTRRALPAVVQTVVLAHALDGGLGVETEILGVGLVGIAQPQHVEDLNLLDLRQFRTLDRSVHGVARTKRGGDSRLHLVATSNHPTAEADTSPGENRGRHAGTTPKHGHTTPLGHVDLRLDAPSREPIDPIRAANGGSASDTNVYLQHEKLQKIRPFESGWVPLTGVIVNFRQRKNLYLEIIGKHCLQIQDFLLLHFF